MIDHMWTICCTRAVIDSESSNMSLQNIIEQITVPKPSEPTAAVGLLHEVVSIWVRSDGSIPARGRGRFRLVAPSGQEVGVDEYEIDLTEVYRLRRKNRSSVFPVGEAGRYHFHVELELDGEDEWREVARVPVTVVHKDP